MLLRREIDRHPNDKVQSVFNVSQLVSPAYDAFNLSLMDSSLEWISSASDMVRLFESIADAAVQLKQGTHPEQPAHPERAFSAMKQWLRCSPGLVIQTLQSGK